MSEINPIPLSEDDEKQVKLWAADDRLWTTQETVEFNLRTFARIILKTNRGIAGLEEPNMDAIKTREINVLVKENNVLRSALTDFVRDAEFRACEESTPGMLLRLAKGRSALADPCRPEPKESKLHAALKETLDCLINETAGNHDTPWVESVKNHANTVLANEH